MGNYTTFSFKNSSGLSSYKWFQGIFLSFSYSSINSEKKPNTTLIPQWKSVHHQYQQAQKPVHEENWLCLTQHCWILPAMQNPFWSLPSLHRRTHQRLFPGNFVLEDPSSAALSNVFKDQMWITRADAEFKVSHQANRASLAKIFKPAWKSLCYGLVITASIDSSSFGQECFHVS